MCKKTLIKFSAPTLAGIKTASMYSAKCHKEKIEKEILMLNKRLNPRGVFLHLMKVQNGRALIYIYRPDSLIKDLTKPEVGGILKTLGYQFDTVEEAINILKKRIIANKEFPHEIGLFLGYPIEDVIGFMSDDAKKYKLAGCWKVYGDEKKAEKLFEKYRKCTCIYTECLINGASIEKLAVKRRENYAYI